MPNKYRARKARCVCRHVHDSILEAEYCSRLWMLERAGKILSYKCQVPFSLAGGIRHVVDFLVCVDRSDCYEVHEAKGFETAVWKIKKKLFEEKYPDIKYVVIRKIERSKEWPSKKMYRRVPQKSVLRRIKIYR